MIGWSSLRLSSSRLLTTLNTKLGNNVGKRMMGHQMEITPSRWQWKKLKDLLHYYTLLGAIPVGAVIFYSNVFIGPATLTETPEGYTPKHWEYHKHPITRFLARYCLPSPQQEYEKYLHALYEEDEKMKMRLLEMKIRSKMAERNDYQSYYYKPISGKQHRIAKKNAEDFAEAVGMDVK